MLPFFSSHVSGEYFFGAHSISNARKRTGGQKKGGLFSYPPVPGLVIAFYWCPFLGKEGQAYGRDRTFWGGSAFVMGRKEKPEGWAWKNEEQYYLSVSPS